jgi:hypothetical protein
MNVSARQWAALSAAAITLAGLPVAIITTGTDGTVSADVCASAGRRISVGGCANLSDVMAPWVPPPDSYAPMPGEGLNACVGYNGRWISANTCG